MVERRTVARGNGGDASEERVRERAHRIWEEEGCPQGRADAHWDMARTQIAIEDNPKAGTGPNPMRLGHRPEDEGEEPVEPLEMVESLGDLPSLTDQGERESFPHRRKSTRH